MTETRTPEEEVSRISIENMPSNSKEEIFKKKLILGGVMFGVIIACTMIATVK